MRLAELKYYEQQFKNVKLTWKLISEGTGVNKRSNEEIIKLKINDPVMNARNNPIC